VQLGFITFAAHHFTTPQTFAQYGSSTWNANRVQRGGLEAVQFGRARNEVLERHLL
jgi:hypothetical protein